MYKDEVKDYWSKLSRFVFLNVNSNIIFDRVSQKLRPRKLKPQTSDPQKLRPLDCLKKKIPLVFKKDSHSHNVHRQPAERSDIYFKIFSSLSLWRQSNSERFKIAADTLTAFVHECSYRRKRRHVQIHTSGCDWWISIWQKFWKHFRGCFVSKVTYRWKQWY